MLGFDPEGICRANRGPAAFLERLEADIQVHRAFDSLDDLENGRMKPHRGEFQSAGITTMRGDQAGLGEALEHLRKKLFRATNGRGQIGAVGAHPRRERSHMNHYADCIIGDTRELHGN